MNNKNFIQKLSQSTRFTQDHCQKMVFSVVDAMNEQFQEGESVSFPSFGTFEVKKRMERIVVNPTTKQRMLVPPKLVVGFRPVASIRRVLKEGGHESFEAAKVKGLSTSPIIAFLMKKHGIKSPEAVSFVGEFIAIINEALRDEKLVKIKGLGTFKVVEVKERQSVDVNTGERIVIEGRSKISFTPDSVMKDLVNKPFSQFDTVVLNDGVTFDDIEEGASEEEPDAIFVDEEPSQEEDTPVELESMEETEEVETPEEELPATVATIPASIADLGNAEKSMSVEEEPVPDEEEPVAVEEGAVIVEEEQIPVAVSPLEQADNPTQEDAPIINEEPVEEEQPIAVNKDEDTETEDNGQNMPEAQTEKEQEEETFDMERNRKSTPWCLYLVIGILSALIGFGAGWFARDYANGIHPQEPETVEPFTENEVEEDTLSTDEKVAELLRKDSLERVRRDSLEQVRRDSIEKARRDSLEKVQQELERVKRELEAQKEDEEKAIREAKQKEQQAADAAAKQNPSLAVARRQVELGAYKIVGTQETITVKEGQTLARLSKFYFGEGMECYLQVHNGITEVKPGMKLKIPKLQWKKKK